MVSHAEAKRRHQINQSGEKRQRWREEEKIQGVSKKRYFLDFLSYFSSRGRILLFHMCFGIRILSPFHLAIQKVSIQNLNCPKNAKNACADMIFIPAQSSLRKAGIKIMWHPSWIREASMLAHGGIPVGFGGKLSCI